jgi:TrmH family RNA methyltransferase
VLASPQTAALWAPKVMRAAQGAHLRLDLREQVDCDRLPLLQLHWIGTDLEADTSLWDAELPTRPIGWVFGAEGQGASTAALAACSMRLRIPLASGVESLNVATAAAVCVFERQRRLRQGNIAILPPGSP